MSRVDLGPNQSGRALRLAAAAAALACALWCSGILADVVKLKSGESVDGEVLLDRPDKIFLRTLQGARWVARADISEIVKGPSVWQKYAELKKKYPQTALGQFELGMWCGENKLAEERERHLKLSVSLDPTFEPGYVALGYVKDGDKWVAPKKETVEIPIPKKTMIDKSGKAVEKTSAKPDDDSERRRNRWAYDISTIYGSQLNRLDPALRRAGAKKILEINDPLATDGLIEQLAARKDPAVRALCARALVNMNNDRALFQILVVALTDSSPDTAEVARGLLRKINDPRVVTVLRKGLEGSEDLLERCVQCLATMRDFDSVPLLVGILVGRERLTVEEVPDSIVGFWRFVQATVHKSTPVFEADAALTSTEVKEQLTGISGPVGRLKSKRSVDPPADKFRACVQEALVLISDREKNFGFDRAAWLDWHRKAAAERAKRPN